MTPEQLSDVFVAALTDLESEGAVDLPDGVPSQVLVERPKVKEHGDYATNVALQLGKRARQDPMLGSDRKKQRVALRISFVHKPRDDVGQRL